MFPTTIFLLKIFLIKKKDALQNNTLAYNIYFSQGPTGGLWRKGSMEVETYQENLFRFTLTVQNTLSGAYVAIDDIFAKGEKCAGQRGIHNTCINRLQFNIHVLIQSHNDNK